MNSAFTGVRLANSRSRATGLDEVPVDRPSARRAGVVSRVIEKTGEGGKGDDTDEGPGDRMPDEGLQLPHGEGI